MPNNVTYDQTDTRVNGTTEKEFEELGKELTEEKFKLRQDSLRLLMANFGSSSPATAMQLVQMIRITHLHQEENHMFLTRMLEPIDSLQTMLIKSKKECCPYSMQFLEYPKPCYYLHFEGYQSACSLHRKNFYSSLKSRVS